MERDLKKIEVLFQRESTKQIIKHMKEIKCIALDALEENRLSGDFANNT
jgi:hypothetical protein